MQRAVALAFVACAVANVQSIAAKDIKLEFHVASGTSISSCDEVQVPRPVWGVKVLSGMDNYIFFHGENNFCPKINPKEDGDQLIFTTTYNCDEQPSSIDVCLITGDDNRTAGLACDSGTNPLDSVDDLACVAETCLPVPVFQCGLGNCSGVSGALVTVNQDWGITVNSSSLITKVSGHCGPPTPAPVPGGPTPEPSSAPSTPAPALACHPEFFQCAGPFFAGPFCCQEGLVCVPSLVDDESSFCNAPPTPNPTPGPTENSNAIAIGAGVGTSLAVVGLVAAVVIVMCKRPQVVAQPVSAEVKAVVDGAPATSV